jgi:uncharacterized membrane protein YgdD (TMEM256/DUF423 family)
MSSKLQIQIAGLMGLLAVVCGAFGAHSLKPMLDEASLQNWDTASRYQFYHALAILIVALLSKGMNSKLLERSALFFLLGIIFFSGSLYLLSVRSLVSFNLLWLGPITPIGGLFFILGWFSLILSQKKN